MVSLHFQPVKGSSIMEVSKSKPVLQVNGRLFQRLNFNRLKILEKSVFIKAFKLPDLGKRTENVRIPLV